MMPRIYVFQISKADWSSNYKMARLDSGIYPELDESTVKRLHSRKIYTVYDFMLQSCDELIMKTGLSFKEIEKLRKLFFKDFGGKRINTYEIYKEELSNIIPTGIKSLDDLLKGGLHCREIYEICGLSSAGKSQLCHWISMFSTLNASTQVHYIDASRNFCASRIQMMLEAKKCSDSIVAQVMSSIKVYQIQDIHQLFSIFHHLSKTLKNEKESRKNVIIVDSLSVLCVLMSTIDSNPLLCNFASVCRFVVNHCRAVVIIVNTLKLTQEGILFTDNEKLVNVSAKPSLGNYWLSVPNVRLLISQKAIMENKRREISVWKSCQLENGKKCFVDFRDEGIF